MSEKYKVVGRQWPYFVTFAVVRWIDVFTRPQYKHVVVDSLNYCVLEKGLVIHAWVLMPNHIHLLIDSHDTPIEFIIRDFKRYTSKILLNSIEDNIQESRDWMMHLFKRAGESNPMNEKYQFWQNGYHPIHCWNAVLIKQKIKYIHANPVRAEFVSESFEWKYGSATDYMLGHGLVKIEKLEIL
jgi:putative transposase